MTFAELREMQPLLANALLETCGGQMALVAMFIDGIAKLATDQTLTAERERCVAHLTSGEQGSMPVAIEAVRSGSPLDLDIFHKHMAAIAARRETPVLRLVPQQQGDQK